MGLPIPHHTSALAVLILYQIPHSLQFTHYVDDPSSCDIIGDTDIYGIGVRLSYYLAYGAGFVVYIANRPDDVGDCRKAFNIVTLAVIINTFRNTARGSFAMLEWYIVFSLVVIIPSVVALATVTKDLTKHKISLGLFIFWYALYLGCQPWLVHVLYQGSRDNCDPKAAFGKLYRWPKLLKLFSIAECVTGVLFLILATLLVGSGLKDGLGLKKRTGNRNDETDHANDAADHGNGGTETGPNFEGKKWLTFRVLTGLVGMFGIVCVERTLDRNKIEMDASVTDTSQLVPFLIGLFSLVSTVWSVFKGFRSRKEEPFDDCPSPWDAESAMREIETEEQQRRTHIAQLEAQEQQLLELLRRLRADKQNLEAELDQLGRKEQECRVRLEWLSREAEGAEDPAQPKKEKRGCEMQLAQLIGTERGCQVKLDISTTAEEDCEVRVNKVRSEERAEERRLTELEKVKRGRIGLVQQLQTKGSVDKSKEDGNLIPPQTPSTKG